MELEESQQQEKAEYQKLVAQDKVLEETESKQKQAEEKKLSAEKAVVDTREQKFQDFLDSAQSLDGLFEKFIEHLRLCTNASGVYVGELENPETLRYVAATGEDRFLVEQKLNKGQGITFDLFEEEEEEEQPEEEEQFDEEGNPIPKKPKEEELKTVFVPNVVLGPNADKTHFFRLARPGCYYALRLRYTTLLNEDTLDEAVDRERRRAERQRRREERERRLLEKQARIAKRKAELAMKKKKPGSRSGKVEEEEDEEEDDKDDQDEDDELSSDEEEERRKKEEEEEKAAAEQEQDGEGDEDEEREKKEEKKPETEEEREARLKREAEEKKIALEERLIRKVNKAQANLAICLDTLGQNRRFTDREMSLIMRFCKHLQATLQRLDKKLFKEERARRHAMIDHAEEAAQKDDDDKDKRQDQILSDLEKADLPARKEDVAYKYRQGVIIAQKPAILQWTELVTFRGPLNILQALLYMLGDKQEQVADPDNKPMWRKIKHRLNDDFFKRIKDYDPRIERKESKKELEKYNSSKSIQELLGEVDYQALRLKNYPLAEISQFITEAYALARRATKERKAAKKAEAERLERERVEREEAEREAREAAEEAEREAQEGAEGDEPEEDDA